MLLKRCLVRGIPGILIIGLFVGCDGGSNEPEAVTSDVAALTADLGRKMFFDENLSSPEGQSCASCHDPETAFTDPDAEVPVSAGVHADRFGNRNTPTAAYAAFSPEFHFDADEGLLIGGQFLDGRAPTLEEQAKGPFLNMVEMANPDKATVVSKVRQATYADQFREVFGEQAFGDVEQAYDQIAEAIAAFERTPEFSPFSSKYDAFLAGSAQLTVQEQRGLQLFEAEEKGNCAACHPSRPDDSGNPPLFTDFSYDNLGVPKNPANPFYAQSPEFNPDGAGFVDIGLGGSTGDEAENGKFKVPTLRNVAITAPYMHNGTFATLREVVDFYNTRDMGTWPPPEVADNVNGDELGNLGLSDQEVNDIVAFLQTLTDEFTP